ncbi:2-hydroxyacid dehydrogenase [Faecalispora jeddahensis]|uniref:2-hydroxyacid dehydrogenase n=1 Tax=Faecalispora jeddahensis TaxID=1414721 RepID=UPI0028B1B8CA|nr:2-hydroxyacid dehydrogenase [Faecalispora jeddahensis]MDU6346691.1 2-hydroxyacid dehydrogenase [Clostridium sp.]
MNIVLAGPYPTGTMEHFQSLLPQHRVTPVLTQEEYDAMTDAECIIVRILKTPEGVIAHNPNLKAVIRWGAGYDSVDIEAAGKRGVMVANTPGVNAYAVAELTLGLMILLSRKIFGYCHNVQSGNWDRGIYGNASFSLNYKTVGIIGGGNIGRQVAARAQAFGARVQYYDPIRLPEEMEQQHRMTFVPLDRLLSTSDLISLHVPLLDSTRHMIGAEQLAAMKPSAYLLNTARGGLIDDAALLESLQKGHLAGVGLDCVEDETSAVTARLLQCPNVIITPHIGGTTADLADAMIPFIAEKVTSLAKTGTMHDIVNTQWLPRS